MNVLQKVRKVLKSALIFAMAFALCGTTLAKAYATYATIIVEHVFVDNNNTFGKNEGKQEAPADKEQGSGEAGGDQPTVQGEDSAAPEENTEAGGEQTPDGAPRDALSEGIDVTISGKGYHDHNPNMHLDCYVEYDNVTVTVSGPKNDKAPAKVETASATLELDLDSADSAQTVADTLSDQLSEQLGESASSDQKLTREQTDAIAEIIEDELQNVKEGNVDEENVWTGRAAISGDNSHGARILAPTAEQGLYDVKLSEDSEALLKSNGYESEMLKITLAYTEYTGEQYVFVSFDGENWTNVDDPEAPQVTTEALSKKWIEWSGEKTFTPTFTYTFVHVRAASYEPEEPKPEEPKPEEPKPEEPKPDPVIPDPDPVIPDPDPVIPDPDPVIPDPDPVTPDPDPVTPPEEENIPDPDVPLAVVPEEEPPVEEEVPEEVEEILEPEVPLADIPETGDISDAWYGAALMAAAGLVALLYQDHRNKKTA